MVVIITLNGHCSHDGSIPNYGELFDHLKKITRKKCSFFPFLFPVCNHGPYTVVRHFLRGYVQLLYKKNIFRTQITKKCRT